MSQTSLEQSLSALMDGEADDLELQRILRESDNPELRAQWQRLHAARWSMRQEAVIPHIDLSGRISEALQDVEMTSSEKPTQPSLWSRVGKVAVAASVTFAVLGGARFYNNVNITEGQAVMASTQQVAPALAHSAINPVVLASYGGPAQDTATSQVSDDSSSWYRERLPAYFRQHNQQTTVSGMETSLPYARAASIEGR
ncbi:MAG: RseA family anti-sigma factor [Thiopseudomonas sp.]|nr:RseA family anti-sigma factor [Thiopseudomonas sp.]MCK9465818.1 RseA family anti-sigma factor [Thiopseudomonas sp.]